MEATLEKSQYHITSHDHVQGSDDAALTLIEYGDYACGYCTQSYPEIEKLRTELGAEMRFIYRHFPIVSPARSELSAEAAEAAGAQGRFWEMHDLLSKEPGPKLSENRLVALARTLELDIPSFRTALQHHQHADRINAYLEEGRSRSVNRTPTFFVNGAHYDGPLDADALRTWVRERSGGDGA